MYVHIEGKIEPVLSGSSSDQIGGFFGCVSCRFFLNKWSKIISGENFCNHRWGQKKKQWGQNYFPSLKKKKPSCALEKKKEKTSRTSIKLIPLHTGNKDFTGRNVEWSRTLKECYMTISSSPASSLCFYKLFSSCRVWSRT